MPLFFILKCHFVLNIGSLLFNVSKTATDTVSFKISNKTAIKQIYRSDLENCFNFTTGDDWYAVTLVQELDLERFYQIWVSVILYYLIIRGVSTQH